MDGFHQVGGWWWQNKNFCARGNYPIENDFANGTNYATGNVVFKANSIPYYHADYYSGCEMARRLYSENKYVYCGLVTGTQWDVMVNKINTATSSNNTTESQWGNYANTSFRSTGYGAPVNGGDINNQSGDLGTTSTFGKITSKEANTFYIMTTGSSDYCLKYGLYDIAGNLWEWTKEPIHFTDDIKSENNNKFLYYYEIRGGGFDISYSYHPEYCRDNMPVAHTNTDERFSLHTLFEIIKNFKIKIILNGDLK